MRSSTKGNESASKTLNENYLALKKDFITEHCQGSVFRVIPEYPYRYRTVSGSIFWN